MTSFGGTYAPLASMLHERFSHLFRSDNLESSMTSPPADQALLCGCPGRRVSDQHILDALKALQIEHLARFGLDTEQDWASLLGLSEQQLLAIARVLLVAPRFVFLDRPSSALDPQKVGYVLALFSQRSISYVTFEEAAADLKPYTAVLELYPGGKWRWCLVEGGQLAEALQVGSA